jgi:hypothetical protein
MSVRTDDILAEIQTGHSQIQVKQINTRSAKAVNLTAANFWLYIILNPCIVLTRHV